MNWGSWSNFFHMGGYGLYVWGAYLVTFLCIAGELFLIHRQKRTLWQRLTLMLRLRQKA